MDVNVNFKVVIGASLAALLAGGVVWKSCPDINIGGTVTVDADGGELADAGVDAGVSNDAGSSFDAGVVVDAGSPVDAGVKPDAGSAVDAGVADAGVKPDAGVADAGTPDAGVKPDAGTVVDAGSPSDAGTQLTWSLTTKDNKILMPNGSVAQLRGATLFDPRMCNACAGVEDWTNFRTKFAIAVGSDWKMNFIRIALEEPSSASNTYYTGLQSTIAWARQTYPNVIIMISLWSDANLLAPAGNSGNIGGPNANTPAFWARVATLLKDEPNVMFSLSNEPAGQDENVVRDAMKACHDAIRAVEDPAKRHIIVAQGTRQWGRYVNFYLGKELGPNVAYETHIYDPQSEFANILGPSSSLPMIVGEFGTGNTPAADVDALMPLLESKNIPYVGWSFTRQCPPDLISATSGPRCGSGTWLPSAWGVQLQNRLAKPYGAP